MKKIAIASDHVGFLLKNPIKEHLLNVGHHINDFGPHNANSVDYPDFAKMVCESIINNENEMGILFCGTGVGMSIVANKIPKIRAVVCSEPYSATMSRAHNNANVLALGQRVVGVELAKIIVDEWIETNFESGRHQKRVDMFENNSND